jgi:hypothetical protein
MQPHVQDETIDRPVAMGSHHDGCVGTATITNSDGSKSPLCDTLKDLCNDIQLVPKLNHVETNQWNAGSFPRNNHSYHFAGKGLTIGLPQGLIVGGDLTDCCGASFDVMVGTHSETCRYEYLTHFQSAECPSPNRIFGCGTPGQALAIIQQLFDRSAPQSFMPLANYPVIAGLKNPDGGIPLKFNLDAGLGNHDLGEDKSGLMMEYIRL